MMRALLAKVYKAFVPLETRNSLRLTLALEDRDRPPRTIFHFAEKRVLVLAPHMDDEIAGPGGTLKLHVEAGSRVTVVFMTNGCLGCIDQEEARRLTLSQRRTAEQECTRIRKAESIAACAMIGVTDVRFFDAPDGALRPAAALISGLSAILTEIAPDIVYHPSLFDLHEDHWQTNRLLGMSLAQLPNLAPAWLRGYEVWTPLLANAVVDISRVADDKRRAFAKFVSQNTRVDYPRAILGLNAYRSLHTEFGRGYAEAFHETVPSVFLRLLEHAKIHH